MEKKVDIKKGDRVSVIDQNLEGIVVSISPKRIAVHCSDGFIENFHPYELIKKESFSFPKLTNSDIKNIHLKENNVNKSFKQTRRAKEIEEIDLHIENLVDNPEQLKPQEIVDIQISAIIKNLDSIQKKQKIVFIHGVGKGFLKEKLISILEQYQNITFQDANFIKYGMGATEVCAI